MGAAAEQLKEFFEGNDRAHGLWNPRNIKRATNGKLQGGEFTGDGPASGQDWEKHLAGKMGLGIHPLRDDAKVRWAAIDADEYALGKDDVGLIALEAKVRKLGFKLMVLRSKSGGAHLVLFFNAPVPARNARKLLKTYAAKLGVRSIHKDTGKPIPAEIFPKQDELVNGNLGNFLNMPYFNGDDTTRYAIHNGKRQTCDEFIALAQSMKMTVKDLLAATSSDEAATTGRKVAKRRPLLKPIQKYIDKNPIDVYHKVLGVEESKVKGGERYAKCPLHEDTKPSLRFNEKGWCCDVCKDDNPKAKGGPAELYAAIHNLDITGDFDRIQQGLFELFGLEWTEDGLDKPGPSVKRKSKTAIVMEALEGREVELFHSSSGIAYVNFREDDGHKETCRVDQFGRFITRLYLKETGDVSIYQGAVSEALAALDARAFDPTSPVRNPALRVATTDDGALYYNPGRADWKVLRSSRDRSELIDYADSPVPFLRTPGMLEVPVPAADTLPLDEIRERFFRILAPEDFLLVLGYIFVALRAGNEYPLLGLHAGAGSGKSKVAVLLKYIIDPDDTESQRLPDDPRDLFAVLINQHFSIWDNCSSISPEMSDVLSQLATGGSVSQRTLYTNFGLTSYKGARPIALTSIPAVAKLPDLADRMIAPAFQKFAGEGGTAPRLEWERLQAAFLAARPAILATVWAAMRGALGEIDSVKLPEQTRMMGPASWMYACMSTLNKHNEWFTAYQYDRADTAARLLDEYPICPLIIELANLYKNVGTDHAPNWVHDGYQQWKGTVTELLAKFNSNFLDDYILHDPKWPRSVEALGSQLNRLEGPLRRAGIVIEHIRKGKNRDRHILIRHKDDLTYKRTEGAQANGIIHQAEETI
jgi:hypothetical protein